VGILVGVKAETQKVSAFRFLSELNEKRPAALADGAYMCILITHWEDEAMRTNGVIDDRLMARALKASGYRTKRSAIEAGLRLLAQRSSQDRLIRLKGCIRWEGNLAEMRRD